MLKKFVFVFFVGVVAASCIYGETMVFKDDFRNIKSNSANWEGMRNWSVDANGGIISKEGKDWCKLTSLRGNQLKNFKISFDFTPLVELKNGSWFGFSVGKGGKSAGVLFQCASDRVFYHPVDTKGKYLYHKAVNYNFYPSKKYNMTIVGSGNRFKLYCDQQLLISIDKSFHSSKLSFITNKARCRIDDLVVVQLPDAPLVARNLLINGDFEHNQDGAPIGWGRQQWFPIIRAWGPTIDDQRKAWRAVPETPLHGTFSLRINHGLPATCTYFNIIPGHDYTFSVYLRADEEETPVSIRLWTPKHVYKAYSDANLTTRVGKQWQRFYVTCPKMKGKKANVSIRALNKKSTIWIDCAQVEKGASASEYRDAEFPPGLLPAGERKSLNSKKTENRKKIIPTITIPVLKDNVKLDGKLDDPVWSKMKGIPLRYGTAANHADYASNVKMFFTNEYLFIAFKGSSKVNPSKHCVKRGKDGSVWLDDAVELFFGGSNLGEVKPARFSFNAIGDKLDGRGYDLTCDFLWDVKTRCYDDGWSAEVRIPIADFFSEAAGAPVGGIRFIVGRSLPFLNNHAVLMTSPATSFHDSKNYGLIKPDSSELFKRFDVNVKELILVEASGDKSKLRMRCEIINRSKKARDLSAGIAESTSDTMRSSVNFHLNPSSLPQFVDVGTVESGESGKKSRYTLIIRDSVDKSIIAVKTAIPRFTPLLNAYFEKNYYTNEKTATVLLDCQKAGDGITLTASIDAKKVFETSLKNPIPSFKIPISAISVGQHQLTVSLLENGKVLTSMKLDFIKRASSPLEMKVNKSTLATEMNGKTYLPFGCGSTVHQKSKSSKIQKYFIDYMAKAGFSDAFIGPHATKYFLSEIQKRDMKITYEVLLHEKIFEKDSIRVMNTIKENLHNTAITTWVVADEADKEFIKKINKFSENAKKIDPYRLMCTINLPNVIVNGNLSPLDDVIFFDAYFWPNTSARMEWDFCRSARKLMESTKRPAWILLQNYGHWLDKPREPFPDEERATVYCAIVAGLKGVYHWSDIPYSNTLWERMSSLKKEWDYLSASIEDETIRIPVKTSSPSVFAVCKGPLNSLKIIAVNIDPVNVKSLTFELPPRFAKVKNLSRCFEPGSITVKNGIVHDSIQRYGRRVYAFKNITK